MRRTKRTNKFRLFLGAAVAIGVPVVFMGDVLSGLGSASSSDLGNLIAFVFAGCVFGAVIAFGDGGRSTRTNRFESAFDNSGIQYNRRDESFDRDWNEINRTTASGFQDSHHVVSGQSLIRTGIDPY